MGLKINQDVDPATSALARDRFDAISDRIAKAYANVPEEEGTAEIDALVAEERAR